MIGKSKPAANNGMLSMPPMEKRQVKEELQVLKRLIEEEKVSGS